MPLSQEVCQPLAQGCLQPIDCTPAHSTYFRLPAELFHPAHPMSIHSPRRGDWFRSKDAPTSIRCCEYDDKPRNGLGQKYGYLEPGTDFGPVHDFDKWRAFVSVKVPSHFRKGELVWVNVENERHGHLTSFAKMYSRRLSGFLD